MITVLAHKKISELLPNTIEISAETHEQISFNLTERQFQTLYDKLQTRGVNPFAAMFWEKI